MGSQASAPALPGDQPSQADQPSTDNLFGFESWLPLSACGLQAKKDNVDDAFREAFMQYPKEHVHNSPEEFLRQTTVGAEITIPAAEPAARSGSPRVAHGAETVGHSLSHEWHGSLSSRSPKRPYSVEASGSSQSLLRGRLDKLDDQAEAACTTSGGGPRAGRPTPEHGQPYVLSPLEQHDAWHESQMAAIEAAPMRRATNPSSSEALEKAAAMEATASALIALRATQDAVSQRLEVAALEDAQRVAGLNSGLGVSTAEASAGPSGISEAARAMSSLFIAALLHTEGADKLTVATLAERAVDEVHASDEAARLPSSTAVDDALRSAVVEEGSTVVMRRLTHIVQPRSPLLPIRWPLLSPTAPLGAR